MKNLKSILLLSALGVASIFTACDNIEDDVPPVNSSNIIVNHDHYTTTKNQGVVFNVLTNDSIGSNAAITFGLPANGTVQPGNTPGTASYQPKNNFIGIDSFSYQACIGGDCASAFVFVEVNDTVCTVKAFDDFETLHSKSYDTTTVLRNDLLCGISPANTVVTITKHPMHGQASVNPMKQIAYFPTDPNYTGPDELTYTISTANGHSSAKIRYNIVTPPCVVKANTDSTFINRVLGTIDTVTVKVFANDIICLNNGPVTINLTGPNPTQYGNFSIIGTGPGTRIKYTTNAGKGFTDRIIYNVCQGGLCSNAYMYVRVK